MQRKDTARYTITESDRLLLCVSCGSPVVNPSAKFAQNNDGSISKSGHRDILKRLESEQCWDCWVEEKSSEYLPTLAEIEIHTASLRSTWDEREHRARAGLQDPRAAVTQAKDPHTYRSKALN